MNQDANIEASAVEVIDQREVNRKALDFVPQFAGSTNLTFRGAIGNAPIKFISKQIEGNSVPRTISPKLVQQICLIVSQFFLSERGQIGMPINILMPPCRSSKTFGLGMFQLMMGQSMHGFWFIALNQIRSCYHGRFYLAYARVCILQKGTTRPCLKVLG
jgi:hypothetical protein